PTDVVGDLNGIFNFDQLDYDGATADAFVNSALVHRMRRRTEIHSAELNCVWGLPLLGGQCSPWRFRALAGFRYFRLSDDLQFASDTVDTVFTGAVDELYYNIDVDNNLYGLQFGGIGERQLGASRWSANFGAKAGIFANQAEADSFIGGAAGAATINNGPNAGRAWDISANKDAVSFLGELQAGVGYRIFGNWRLLAEYRIVGLSGVALPSNQIYQDLRGLQDVQLLAANGSLILHGAFFGVERLY
ncbi:MAG: BBP7 family outer membrane beta-barrel protein, partial [Planctomycetota bacterium]